MVRKPQWDMSVPEAAAGEERSLQRAESEAFLVRKVLPAGCFRRECLQCMVLHLDEEKMMNRAYSSIQKNGQKGFS